MFQASRLASADPNAGVGLELSAIAAVVIGGTSLMGGRGSVVSSFFGVLIIETLFSGLAQIGAEEEDKRVITGAVIVLAVIANIYRQRLAGRVYRLLRRLAHRARSSRHTPCAGPTRLAVAAAGRAAALAAHRARPVPRRPVPVRRSISPRPRRVP